ncbi:MAG: DUF6443 domain-containing protein [Bacteroidota bacterium]
MNRRNQQKQVIVKVVVLVVLLVSVLFSHAQNTEYVGEETLTGNITSNYVYTKSVTIKPEATISSANGNISIRAYATNPPPASSNGQNYVRVEVPKTAVSSEQVLTNMGPDEKTTSYSYSDGLGRGIQDVVAEGGPGYEDIVQHHEHAATGRQETSYLPYVKSYSEPGGFISDAKNETTAFYANPPTGIAGDTKPQTINQYENSPGGPMEAGTGVGADWHTNNKKSTSDYFLYEKPVAVDQRLVNWKVNIYGDLIKRGEHPSYLLQVVESVNEDNIKSQSITDSRGRNIAVRTWFEEGADSRWITTYYVYDSFNRLRYILPPAISNEPFLTETQLKEFAFQYQYDYRGRLISERNPGSGETLYVYDPRNRLVFSQDEEQRKADQWIFRKYDRFNRLIITGLESSDKTQTEWADVLKTATGTELFETTTSDAIGYTTNSSYPNTYDELLTITYYDGYYFINNSNWDTDLSSNPFGYQPSVSGVHLPTATGPTKGLTTGSKVKVLGTEHWLNSVIYYDDEYRTIQVVSENHLGGYDRISNQLHDYNGILQKMKLEHTSATEAVSLLSEYQYDHEFRLLKAYEQINNDPKVLTADYRYNALGELVEKNLYSTNNGQSFLQSVDYRYNIRGWLSSINNHDLSESESKAAPDLFGANYHYQRSPIIAAKSHPRYDGSLAAMTWKASNVTPAETPEGGPQSGKKTGSGYKYDGLGRLDYTKYGTGNTFSSEPDFYSVNPDYDDNGNISKLIRNAADETGQASEQIDDLTYEYDRTPLSNRLDAIRDAGTPAGFNNTSRADGTSVDMLVEYEYDDNGNLTRDPHKEMTITYNFLQLPSRIEFDYGASIAYTYDATGNRLSKTVTFPNNNKKQESKVERMDYIGLVEYKNGSIYQLFTEEGRALKQNNQYFYEYFLTDHQGNNRVAFGVLPERHVYRANMEGGDADTDFAFPTPNEVRQATQNHTSGGTKSANLFGNNGVEQNAVGPAKVLDIAVGDEVEMEVWAKYDDGVSWNNSSISTIATLVSSIFGGASTGVGAERAVTSLENALQDPGDYGLFENAPKEVTSAYLQYLFFDKSYTFRPEHSSYVSVSDVAEGQWERLETGKLSFPEAGYLFVYVSNESDQPDIVYFDDLKIIHESPNSSFKVSQVNDYYPFGMLTQNSWRNPDYQDPGLLYQSYYNTYDSLSETHDFFLRNYDPTLGRWLQVDPYNQFASPYAGMGNSPHVGVDPDGGFWHLIAGAAVGGYIGGSASSLADGQAGWANPGKWGRDDWRWAAGGAVAGAFLSQGFFGHKIGDGTSTFGAKIGVQNPSFSQQFRANIERLLFKNGSINGIHYNNGYRPYGWIRTISNRISKGGDFPIPKLHGPSFPRFLATRGITTKLASVTDRVVDLTMKSTPSPSRNINTEKTFHFQDEGDLFRLYGTNNPSLAQFRPGAIDRHLQPIADYLNEDPSRRLNAVIRRWDHLSKDNQLSGRDPNKDDVVIGRSKAIYTALRRLGVSREQLKSIYGEYTLRIDNYQFDHSITFTIR